MKTFLYFVLTFVISWGAVLIVVGPAGFPASTEQAESALPVIVFATLAGPSVAAIVLTGLFSGRDGVRSLFRRFLKWRVGWVGTSSLC